VGYFTMLSVAILKFNGRISNKLERIWKEVVMA
jgi:hypothetical protein